MQHKETNRSIYHYWLIIGLFLTMVTLFGCSGYQPDVQESELVISNKNLTPMAPITTVPPSITLAPASIPTSTPTTTATSSPSATPTATATATQPPTVRPTLVSTLTPLPTIEPQQRGQSYTDLMRNNGGCTLPCWWGFELGATNIGTVKQFYSSLGANVFEQKYPDNYSVVEALFVDAQIENGVQTNHTFLVRDDDVVIEVEIEVNIYPEYQIEPILQRLGQPSEVWMWTIPESREGILPADFLLYFPARGVLVSYAVFAERIDDIVQVCFDERGSTILLLWEPTIWDIDKNKGFVERANKSSNFTLQGERPIDEVSNWDAEQFYTVLTDPTRSECLETPSNLWTAP